MNGKRNNTTLLKDPLLLIFVLFLIYPLYPYIGNFVSLGTELLIWGLFALSFNLLLGYTGLASFGHGAFYGVGTYAAAITSVRLLDGHGFLLPIIVAALAGGLFTFVSGFFLRKKRGIYFALMTVAFSQILYVIAFRWSEVTGGETGITGLRRGTLFGFDMSSPLVYFYFVLIIFIIGAFLIRRIARSPFGKTLKAIKQDEKRAKYLGYDTEKYIWYIFTISGVFAGLAGGLYCMLHNSAFSDILHWTKSGDVVMATLLGGGMVNFYGPIVGSVIFITARELLSAFWENWMLLYGLSFVIIILFIPTGLMGIVERFTEQKQFSNLIKDGQQSDQVGGDG